MNLLCLSIATLLAVGSIGSCDCLQCWSGEKGGSLEKETCDPNKELCLTLTDDDGTTLSCATEAGKKVGCKAQQCYCDADLCNSSSTFSSTLWFLVVLGLSS